MRMQNEYILVIEDDSSIRNMLCLALEMSDYPVMAAANGHEALTLLCKTDNKPSLILLDLMMPIMDGWTFAKKLEENPKLKDIPIVVLTAFADRAGPIPNSRALLRKPVDFAKLMTVVETYCRGNGERRSA
jgi:CheY-like chemotaxis protein